MRIGATRKGQAALEFLTTYGWAFLVILIMIGTLAYFGILSPSKILPNRCNIGPEFECVDYQISAATNEFKLRLKNNVGEPIIIQSIAIGSESATTYSCSTPPLTPLPMSSGRIEDLKWSNCNSAASGIVAGEKGKVFVKIRYYSATSGPNYAKESYGEVLSTVV
ncbi:hypothetical protein HYY71_02650 [Candidatus Woesearchaeota archaeon]|nr:hypothetical protein [Candidatus Woesearchaeota archaeon]